MTPVEEVANWEIFVWALSELDGAHRMVDVEEVLSRSQDELRLWVELARGCRSDGLDLDHAVIAVRDRTRERYAAMASEDEKWQALSSDRANLSGILHWLDRTEPGAC